VTSVEQEESGSTNDQDLAELAQKQAHQINMYRKKQQTRFYNAKGPGKVVILGDSMIKHLKGNKLSRFNNVKCFTHRGARIEELLAPARKILQEEKPSTVIVHAGTNNNNDPEHVIINKTHHLATTLQQAGVARIALSGIIGRANGDSERTCRINLGVAQVCRNNGWQYIDNNNIGPHYLSSDGVHLNRSGTILLAKNMIAYLRGDRQGRTRIGTSYADALRIPPTSTQDFHRRGIPLSRWKHRTAEQIRLLRLAQRL